MRVVNCDTEASANSRVRCDAIAGRVAEQRQRTDEAEQLYDQALALDPIHVPSLRGSGSVSFVLCCVVLRCVASFVSSIARALQSVAVRACRRIERRIAVSSYSRRFVACSIIHFKKLPGFQCCLLIDRCEIERC